MLWYLQAVPDSCGKSSSPKLGRQPLQEREPQGKLQGEDCDDEVGLTFRAGFTERGL